MEFLAVLTWLLLAGTGMILLPFAITTPGAGLTGLAGRPPGSAGIIAIHEHAHAELVDTTLANAIRKSIAQIDKASAAELKDGLKQASAALSG